MKFRVYCLVFQVEELESPRVANKGARAPLPGWFSFTRRVVLIHRKPLYVQHTRG